MDESLKIRSAAVAGWWTVLVGAGFLAIQWLLYLALMSSRPGWLLALWGPGTTWETVRLLWFWAMAVFKLCLWVLALGALWLTFWARRLRTTR
jgi:hypothetical protein